MVEVIHLYIVYGYTAMTIAFKEMQSLTIIWEYTIAFSIYMYNNLIGITTEIFVDNIVPVRIESFAISYVSIGYCLKVLLDVVLHQCQCIYRFCWFLWYCILWRYQNIFYLW